MTWMTRLAALAKRKLGLRKTILRARREANLVWALRKAGLSLLTGRKGDAKPVTGIEDTAVRPKDLPAYVAGAAIAHGAAAACRPPTTATRRRACSMCGPSSTCTRQKT